MAPSSLRPELLFWLVKKLERSFWYLINYPNYDEGQIVVGPLATSSSQSELRLLRSFRPNHRLSVMVLSLSYAIFAIKTLTFSAITLSSVNFAEPMRNLRHLGHTQTHFVCVTTNCSRLSEANQLHDDLIVLPFFSICKPNFRPFFNPFKAGHTVGLLCLTQHAFWAAVCGCILPAYILLKGALPNWTALFILCPELSLHQASSEIRRLLATFSYSFVNFRLTSPLGRSPRQPSWSIQLVLDNHLFSPNRHHPLPSIEPSEWRKQRDELASPSLRLQSSALVSALHRLGQLTEEFEPRLGLEQKTEPKAGSDGDDQYRDYVADCLPLCKTGWWRQKLTEIFVKVFFEVLLVWTYGFLMAIVLVDIYVMHPNRRLYHQFADYIDRHNCSMWLSSSASNSTSGLGQEPAASSMIDLREASDDWNLYTFTEELISISILIYIISIALANFYCLVIDQKLWLMELAEEMSVAIEFTQLVRGPICHRKLVGEGLEAAQNQRRPSGQRFLLSAIKDRIKPNIYFNIMLLLRLDPFYRQHRPPTTGTASTRTDTRLAYLEFAHQLRSRFGSSADVHVELLEKIHINHWHFMLALRQHHASVTAVLLISQILNYGYSIIAVYFYRNVKGFVLGPLTLNSLSIVTIYVIIGLSSEIHAHARRLERQFWSLTALTADWPDERVVHLRHLWMKQLRLIGEAGGLAQKFFNINVTYAGIIQVLVWTVSILLLAYTRH